MSDSTGLPDWVRCKHLFVEPANAEKPEDITERLRAEITARDASSAVLSNLQKPRGDNNEGRCAQLLEDAVGEIERLRSNVAEACGRLDIELARRGWPGTERVNTPMPIVNIPLSRPLTSRELADLQAYPNEIERLRARISSLEMYAIGVKEERDAALASAAEKIDRLRTREAKLMSLLLQEDMGAELANSVSEIEGLKKTIRGQGELVDRLRADLAELEQKYQGLYGRHQAAEPWMRLCEKQASTIASLQDSVTARNATMEALGGRDQKQRARIAELEAALRLLADLGHHATWADINEARKTLGLSLLP
jgi:hypothetical protein